MPSDNKGVGLESYIKKVGSLHARRLSCVKELALLTFGDQLGFSSKLSQYSEFELMEEVRRIEGALTDLAGGKDSRVFDYPHFSERGDVGAFDPSSHRLDRLTEWMATTAPWLSD